MSNPDVAILLGTYNGQAYLSEQIESIRRQSYKNWIALVRDDDSTDETREILRKVASEEQRIIVLEDDLGNLGVKGNFDILMKAAVTLPCSCFMFADQDDYWLPNKIEVMHSKMVELGREYGENVSLLAYSDMKVADASLKEVNESFFAYQGIKPLGSLPLQVLLAQNVVSGCASIFNKTLLELAVPIPSQAIMHDWWLALVSASEGKLFAITQPLSYYRQHKGNRIGAVRLRSAINPLRKHFLEHVRGKAETFRATLTQATALEDRLAERERQIDARVGKLIREYGTLNTRVWWRRPVVLLAHSIHRQGMLRHCFLILSSVFLIRRNSPYQVN